MCVILFFVLVNNQVNRILLRLGCLIPNLNLLPTSVPWSNQPLNWYLYKTICLINNWLHNSKSYFTYLLCGSLGPGGWDRVKIIWKHGFNQRKRRKLYKIEVLSAIFNSTAWDENFIFYLLSILILIWPIRKAQEGRLQWAHRVELKTSHDLDFLTQNCPGIRVKMSQSRFEPRRSQPSTESQHVDTSSDEKDNNSKEFYLNLSNNDVDVSSMILSKAIITMIEVCR